MKKFNTIEEILDFAIRGEQEAVDLYTRLSDEATIPEMRDVFMQFAREEMSHKARLLKVKEEGVMEHPGLQITDMKISDYTSEVEISNDMDYRDALVLAMGREKNAFKLYTRLATEAPNPGLRDLFLSLAQEEARHKLRFELEYDEYVLRDN
jgi:rubrerythrin